MYIDPTRGVEVAKRHERNEWHAGGMSERECDRAAARPSTVRKGINTTQKTKINPDRPLKICRGSLYIR